MTRAQVTMGWVGRVAKLWVIFAFVFAGFLAAPRTAMAGEEDDLQRQIETQRSGANDLDRLDELRATTDEITLLRTWLTKPGACARSTNTIRCVRCWTAASRRPS